MMNDNIRKYRKEKGFSQEELAVMLHVVRQTVSKWEKGLSVPDAAVLINMASVLDVPVNKLLGIEVESSNTDDLTSKLACLNEELAKKNQRENLVNRSNEKRGMILLLCFASMFIALIMKNPIISVLLTGGCIILAAVILYRNMALLTSITTDDLRLKPLRVMTVFDMVLLILGIVLVCLTAANVLVLSEQDEKLIAMLLVACVMVVAGMISPNLPYTRHTGLRLPWTIQDQDTWNLAHRIVGCISLPLALLYIVCSLTIEDFELITLIAMILWVGIPGGISYAFFWKKMNGKQ